MESPVLAPAAVLLPEREKEVARPRTRQDCALVPRPCPFVSCRYHTWAERPGVVRYLRGWSPEPDVWPWELAPGLSCALDVADEGGVTLDDCAAAMGWISRERARQVEADALAGAAAELARLRGLEG